MSSVPPVPYQTPMTDKSGVPSQPWAAWFRQLLSTVLSPPAANITGVVQVDQGGTGQITQQAALDAIAGAQVAGKVLRSDGTHTTLSAIQAADVPTLNQNTTGTAAGFSGSLSGDVTGTQGATVVGKVNGLAVPLSKTIVGTNASGQIVDASTAVLTNDTTGLSANVTGVVQIINGGTNATTANGSLNNLLPSQTGNSGKFLKSDGTNTSWSNPTISLTAPTVQRFTSGSGTYTAPTSPAPLYIKVTMSGGGGGGGGVGSGGNGGAGGTTTFGTSLLTCNGGSGGAAQSSGSSASGGTVSVGAGATELVSVTGGSGDTSGAEPGVFGGSGGMGGSNPLGGAGAKGTGATNTAETGGFSAVANTGAGGGGAGGNGSLNGSAGGGAGGYLEALIASPSATYSYAVGAAGSAGTGTYTGGSGGSGVVIVQEFYQ